MTIPKDLLARMYISDKENFETFEGEKSFGK